MQNGSTRRLKEPRKKLRKLREFLTRWSFENLLDRLAKYLSNHVSEGGELGCSLIYIDALNGSQAYVGGSSSDRRKLEARARMYDINEHQKSFTSYSLHHFRLLVLDDFLASIKDFSSAKIVEHSDKACEMPASSTKSFYCRPLGLTEAGNPTIVKSIQDVDSLPLPNERASGAIRFSGGQPALAGKIDDLLDRDMINMIHSIIASGREKVAHNLHNEAQIIAEFESNLLDLSEMDGLDRITSHLQSIFYGCECSIFTAEREPADDLPNKKISLRLAANDLSKWIKTTHYISSCIC